MRLLLLALFSLMVGCSSSDSSPTSTSTDPSVVTEPKTTEDMVSSTTLEAFKELNLVVQENKSQ